MLALMLYAMPTQAEHASSAHFESPLPQQGFSGGTIQLPANDGKPLALPGAKPPALPPLVGGNLREFSISGPPDANRGAVATNTSRSSPFSDGYRPPQISPAPEKFIPFPDRIGVSRVSSD